MRNQSGFTIIELLMTVAVVGVLIAVALPNYNIFVRNNCLTTTTNNLVTSLQMARSESIKRSRNVGVHAASGWGSGWIVFDDEDNDYTYDSGTDDILRDNVVSCGIGNMTITEVNGAAGSAPNPNDTTANDTTFIYESTGFINSAATFELCDNRPDEIGRMITISITGRPNTNSEFAGCNP